MSPRRAPLVTDSGRIEAARIAAEGLAARMNTPGYLRVMLGGPRPVWHHIVDSLGGITSEASSTR